MGCRRKGVAEARTMEPPAVGAKVWAKVADGEAYARASVASASGSGKVHVDLDAGGKLELQPSEVLESNPGPAIPDLTTMVVLNAATMLNNVRERYSHDLIYTRAANMLVAVNPGHPLPELYTEQKRAKSREANLRDPRLEPHLYDVAEQAFRQLSAERTAQSIIVSGESGAGKTESIKYCMNYLVWRSESEGKGDGGRSQLGAAAPPPGVGGAGDTASLTQRIMQSNPLLEALPPYLP